MNSDVFSAIEESVSFYTRNDFAILNCLLTGSMDELWKYAQIAYEDNRCILREYENGERKIEGDYDVKWQNILRKRLINQLDEETKARILETAKSDIANLLGAMTPAGEPMLLYRTAWVDSAYEHAPVWPYSRQYRALTFGENDLLEFHMISSASLTPYREDEDVGSDFCRYEITVPEHLPVLALDPFVCHNEDGEVLLPPMRCRVTDICDLRTNRRAGERCRGIIRLTYTEPLPFSL